MTAVARRSGVGEGLHPGDAGQEDRVLRAGSQRVLPVAELRSGS